MRRGLVRLCGMPTRPAPPLKCFPGLIFISHCPLIAPGLVFAFLLLAGGCTSNTSRQAVVGTWNPDLQMMIGNDPKRREEARGFVMTIVFQPDGKFETSTRLKADAPIKHQTGTFRISGTTVYLTVNGQESELGDLQDDRLWIRAKNALDVMVLKRG
jgi:hypothetical protein